MGKKQEIEAERAADKMRGDRRFGQTTHRVETELSGAVIYASERFAKAIGIMEGRDDVTLSFSSTLDKTRTVMLDDRRIGYTFNVVGNDNWAGYCKAGNRNPENMLGVTLGRREIFTNMNVASDPHTLITVYPHEPLHVLSMLRSEALREGIADRWMYEFVQQSPDIDPERKAAARIGYKEYAAIDYLVEQIAGRDYYVYAHAKGGEDFLAARFDNICKRAGSFAEIFYGHMSKKEKIDALMDIIERKMPIASKNIEIQKDLIIEKGELDFELQKRIDKLRGDA